MTVLLVVVGVIAIIVMVAMATGKKDAQLQGYSSIGQSSNRPIFVSKHKVVNSPQVQVDTDAQREKEDGFVTPEVKALAEEYNGEYHAEYPFLDPNYSPDSHIPFADLTLYVGEWIGAKKEKALYELWRYISDFRSEVAMREALRMAIPEGVDISEFARNEILAIYALTLRSHLAVDHADCSGAAMMATTFSTREVKLSPPLMGALLKLVKYEFKSRNQESGAYNYDLEAEAKAVADALEQGVSGCENFAAIMKTLPPTARVAISDSMRDTRTDGLLWNRRIHYSLGYEERAYGCSEKLNRECVVSLNILEPADPETFGVPSTVTKAMIMDALLRAGVPFKKSAKRDELLHLAKTVPSLVAELVNAAEPDLMIIKSEYAKEARIWAQRNQALFPFALAFMAYMGLDRIKQSTRQTTLRKVLDNQATRVNGEFKYATGKRVGG